MPRAGLEPARPFGPEDFLTTIAFATCRSFQVWQFVVWTMPSPCISSPALFEQANKRCLGGSRLVSTLCWLPSLSSALPFNRCCLGFAEFDSIHASVSIRRAQIISNSLSPLCLPFHHPGQTAMSLCIWASSCKWRAKAVAGRNADCSEKPESTTRARRRRNSLP
jgi:hypothetical protein